MTPALVEQFLQRLNDAWLAQDYVALAPMYHPDVVLLPPDVGEAITGRDQVLQTYRDFHASCRVESFRVQELLSWTVGATTMAHMRFEIDYQLGQPADQDAARQSIPLQSERGLEVYTLNTPTEPAPAHSESTSQIVWRAQFAL